METLELAPQYADELSFFGVTITQNGSKKPTADWKERQSATLPSADVNTLLTTHQALGIACGNVSGGLVVFDFDAHHERFYPAWLERVQSFISGTLTVRTYSGGVHVYVRCDTPCRNEKLAYTMAEQSRVVAIETRGEGGYVVAAGSHGPHGNYTIMHGNYDTIAVLDDSQFDYLLFAARQLCEAPYDDRIDSKRRETASVRDYGGSSVIEQYNLNNSIEGVLEIYGYRHHRSGRMIRPSGENPTVHIDSLANRSYHHNSNDPLNGYWQTPFSVYCHFGYGGDAKAAVRAYLDTVKPQRDPLMRTYDKSVRVDDAPSASDDGNTEPTMHPLMVFSHDLYKLPPMQPIISGLFNRRGITMAWGPSGSGKSFLFTDYSHGLSTTGWKVLYVAGEGSSGYDERSQAWYNFQSQHGHTWDKNEAGRCINPNLCYWTDSVQIIDRASRLAFIEAIRWFGPDLIIFDTLAQCTVGYDPNSQKDMAMWCDALKEIYKALGCGVAFVHHTNKSGAEFAGAQTLFNAVDLVVSVTKNADDRVEIASRKVKDGKPFPRKFMRLLPVGESAVLVDADRVIMQTNPHDLTDSEEKILEIMNLSIYVTHGCKHRQLKEESGFANSTISSVLSRLKNVGLIRQGAKGDPYFITKSGIKALDGEYGYQVVEGYGDTPLAPPAVPAKVAEVTQQPLDNLDSLRLELDDLFEQEDDTRLLQRLEEINSPQLSARYFHMLAVRDGDDDGDD